MLNLHSYLGYFRNRSFFVDFRITSSFLIVIAVELMSNWSTLLEVNFMLILQSNQLDFVIKITLIAIPRKHCCSCGSKLQCVGKILAHFSVVLCVVCDAGLYTMKLYMYIACLISKISPDDSECYLSVFTFYFCTTYFWSHFIIAIVFRTFTQLEVYR